MIPAPFDYLAASSAQHAIDLLAEHGDDAKILAGGHSLLPLMKLRLATPSVLVDRLGAGVREGRRDHAALPLPDIASAPATTACTMLW